MTRSIFDPTCGETERSGSTFTALDAGQLSHMPSDAIDGVEATDESGDNTVEASAAVPSGAPGSLPASPEDAREAGSPGLVEGADSRPGLGTTPRDLA